MPDRPPRLRVGKPRETPRVWVEPADERGSAHSRGYGVAWRRVREVVLQAEPLCRHCMERGMVTPAVEVDHIRPLRDGGTNDRENLQPLCCACHDDKTARDIRARMKGQLGGHPPGGASKFEAVSGTDLGNPCARGRKLHNRGAEKPLESIPSTRNRRRGRC